MEEKPKASLWKSLRLGLGIIAIVLIYAYGFQVTKVDLAEFRKESRQDSRIRVLRALARPDIFEYDQEEFTVYAPIYVPCPEQPPDLPPPDTSQPYLVLSASCGKPNESIQVEGFNFQPNIKGPIFFVPSSDPYDTLALQRGNIETDSQGHFATVIRLPNRPSAEVQYIKTITRRNVGLPRFSQTAIDTWDKIIETIFLALLATTIGTIFSIPISFFAARNLMKDIKSSLTSIALAALGWPLGIAIGLAAARWVQSLLAKWSDQIAVSLIIVLGAALIGYLLLRWAVFGVSREEEGLSMKLLRSLAQSVSILAWIVAFFALSQAGVRGGFSLASQLGNFAFLGNFIGQISDVITVLLPTAVALGSGAWFGNLGGQIGTKWNDVLPIGAVKALNSLLSAIAGATLFALCGWGIGWLYEIRDIRLFLYLPAVVGATLGILLALLTPSKQPLPIGLAIYTITRTILNAVRSIEALIMAIVAVIWVGIGPFAGVLALGLHTIASLAKLYSEQVESILPGPIEAITATGATRLQTIVYAVLPQIIPPYISFTMYRWDINVRMSTIIGFAGGGGIGFLLIQNINLLNYRAASTQMIAIAIVVSAMDYLSSAMRERFV
ncbi:MAG: ABC transporter permease subunit [Anaerolineales bacterium]